MVQQTSSQLSQVTAPSPLAAGVQHQQQQHGAMASFPSGGITTPMVIDAAQISGPGPAASSNVVPAPTPSAPTQTDNLDNTALAQEGGLPVLATPTADQAAAASTAVDQSATQTPAAAAAAVDQSAVQTAADPPSLPSASTTTAAHGEQQHPGTTRRAAAAAARTTSAPVTGSPCQLTWTASPAWRRRSRRPARCASTWSGRARAEDEVEPQPCKHKPARAQTPAQATDWTTTAAR